MLLRDADERPPVVAHTDWSARNLRLDEERLLAVYDWDSVALVPESTGIGQAAVTWSVTADPGGTEFPTLADIGGFVADYEAAAGYRLDDEQWRAAGAAAAYTLAYTARCEHALEAGRARPGSTSTPRTTGWPTPARRCSPCARSGSGPSSRLARGRPRAGSGAACFGRRPASRERPAQQHLDLGVDAAELVVGPAGDRVVDGGIDAEQDLPPFAHV